MTRILVIDDDADILALIKIPYSCRTIWQRLSRAPNRLTAQDWRAMI